MLFVGPTSHRVAGVILSTLLIVACASDLRARRIPNVLVLVIAALGIAWSFYSHAPAEAAIIAFGGLATGLVLWFPFFALNMLGAGDVKLFAAASAWIGARAAIEASLLTAGFGGVLALLYMLTTTGTADTLLRLSNSLRHPQLLRQVTTPRARRMPYAIAITAGLITALIFPGIVLSSL